MGRAGSAWSGRHAASVVTPAVDDGRIPLPRLFPLTAGAATALLVVGLLLVGAGVRALRFGGRFRYLYHWDETGMAIPALRIPEGDLPAVRWAGPLCWTGSELLALGRHAGEWTFPSVELRYLRLSLRGPAPGRPWAIDAIDLFE